MKDEEPVEELKESGAEQAAAALASALAETDSAASAAVADAAAEAEARAEAEQAKAAAEAAAAEEAARVAEAAAEESRKAKEAAEAAALASAAAAEEAAKRKAQEEAEAAHARRPETLAAVARHSAQADLVQSLHETLRKDLRTTLLDELESLSESQLRARVLKLNEELHDRARWEAVRMSEFLERAEQQWVHRVSTLHAQHEAERRPRLACMHAPCLPSLPPSLSSCAHPSSLPMPCPCSSRTLQVRPGQQRKRLAGRLSRRRRSSYRHTMQSCTRRSEGRWRSISVRT